MDVNDVKVGARIIPQENNGGHNYRIGYEYEICFINHSNTREFKARTSDNAWIGNWLRADECKLVKSVETPRKNRNLINVLVIPDGLRELILETVSQAKEEVSETIFKKWGFELTLEKGRGVIILFWGPPGTGKTMCAEAVAEMLDKSFMLLGTKDFQSSIPGQTERNIADAFKKAREKDSIIVLDECDSVLYNRNEVGAILAAEINTLLSEIERFEGICILTTNRSVRLDPALARRLALKVEFTKPDKISRTKIWRNLIPKQAPLHKDVCFEKLSEYDLTGGQIKNAILTGVRKAANRKNERITYRDLLVGIKMELLGQQAWNMTDSYKVSGGDLMLEGGQLEQNLEKTMIVERRKDEQGEA